MQQTMKQGGKKTAIRVIGVVLTILLVLILCFLIGARVLFGELLIAAETVEKREEGLYTLEYRGDYGFDEFLARGGASSDAEVADYLTQFLSRGFYRAESAVEAEAFGCSTLAVKDENGSVLFGRNYDWAECETMIVHTVPKDGYESV
ncbi:MAG: linear amide C-N hydrolase, partial [Christensenellaceae bacterium]